MNRTLPRHLRALSRDADKGEYATGQYRGMLMRALALTAPTAGGLPSRLPGRAGEALTAARPVGVLRPRTGSPRAS